MPYTDMAEPRRANVRSDKELPKLIKSKTDIDDPRRVIPYIDKAEPKRA
jgi:hypothetical protein